MSRTDQLIQAIKTHGPLTYAQASAILGITIRSAENAMRRASMMGDLCLVLRGSSSHGTPSVYGLPEEGYQKPEPKARSYAEDIEDALRVMSTFTTAELAAFMGIRPRQAADAIIKARQRKQVERVGSVTAHPNVAIYGRFGSATIPPNRAPMSAALAGVNAIRYGGYIGAAPARAPWLDFTGWPESSAPLVSRARGGEGVV